MSNPFYTPSGAPITGSAGLSAIMRSEFDALGAAFDKLPSTLTSNGVVVINPGGTGMLATTTPALGAPTASSLSLAGLALGGNVFAMNGNALIGDTLTVNGNVTMNADATVGHITAQGTGGGTFIATGFGQTAVYSTQGLTTTDGNGIKMICVSAGVILNNGASAWAAISDYRAKIVSGRFTGSGAIIDAIPVHLAALKETPENTKAMFLAHEVQAKIPYAVHGEKDGEKMQVLDSTDPLFPILWAEVQSLRKRLAARGI